MKTPSIPKWRQGLHKSRRRRVRVSQSSRVVEKRVRSYSKTMANTAAFLFKSADEIFNKASSLDSAVRDSVSVGLAHIVHAANDCTASNMDLTTEQWMPSPIESGNHFDAEEAAPGEEERKSAGLQLIR